MVEAIIGNGFYQIGFCVLNLAVVDAQPFNKSVLHNVFCVSFAAKQVISNVVQHRLVENNGL
jgi:hypothetical protein